MADRRVWEVVEFVGTPAGHAQVTATGSAASLPSVPSTANRAIIRTKSAGIAWRDDGVAPTPTTGMYLLTDETLVYDGTLSAFQLVALTGSPDVRIAYYVR